MPPALSSLRPLTELPLRGPERKRRRGISSSCSGPGVSASSNRSFSACGLCTAPSSGTRAAACSLKTPGSFSASLSAKCPPMARDPHQTDPHQVHPPAYKPLSGATPDTAGEEELLCLFNSLLRRSFREGEYLSFREKITSFFFKAVDSILKIQFSISKNNAGRKDWNDLF
jgi:hypothetical protein